MSVEAEIIKMRKEISDLRFMLSNLRHEIRPNIGKPIKGIDDICRAMSISRDTFNKNKVAYRERGIAWYQPGTKRWMSSTTKVQEFMEGKA